MIKTNLETESFILAYSSRRIRVHHGGEAWQLAVDMETGAGSQEVTALTLMRSQEGELEMG